MKKMRAWLAGVLLSGAVLVALGACGAKGEDGEAYLSLDWTYTPLTVYFPMLPPTVGAGTYYLHPPGTYYGEYTAWSGDFYSFWYTIQINEGSYGIGEWPGEDGADRFYSMILRSWGPELYYIDVEQRSLSGTAVPSPDPSEEEAAGSLDRERQTARNLTMEKRELGLESDSLGEPEEFRWEQRGPGWSFSVEGQHYPVLK